MSEPPNVPAVVWPVVDASQTPGTSAPAAMPAAVIQFAGMAGKVTADVTEVTLPMFEPTKAKPLAAPGALPAVKSDLPIEPATVKSPAVMSCHTAEAITAAEAPPPVGALARAAVVYTDDEVVVKAPPS